MGISQVVVYENGVWKKSVHCQNEREGREGGREKERGEKEEKMKEGGKKGDKRGRLKDT